MTVPPRQGPTLHLLLGLCARLRLACEAIGPEGIDPAAVSLDDLAAGQRARLERLAQQDLWAIINASGGQPAEPVRPAIQRRDRRRRAS